MFRSEISRRDLVRAGLVASILPLASWAGAQNLSALQAREKTSRLHRLIVDRNIPESIRLGALAGAIADEVSVFDGDLTRLWNDELRLQWLQGPRPIAGLTAPGVRFVLEQFGRDHDARIVFSAEHRKVTGGIRHGLSGNDALLRSTEFDEGADWVAEMAKLVVTCPHEPGVRGASVKFTSERGTGMSSDRPALVTWVLAPIASPDRDYNSKRVS